MAYFQNFETLVYDVVGDDNPKLFTHILRRVKINDLVKDNDCPCISTASFNH